MEVKYIASINNTAQISEIKTKSEVCFFGRSNAGKSSLINALLKQKIAFTSKKPGKTISLNFYQFGKSTLLDTPGYGFAGKSSQMSIDWEDLVGYYLGHRKELKMCYILIDSRRGIMNTDMDMIDFLEHFEVKYTIIYTKIDKLSQAELSEVRKNDMAILRLNQYIHIPQNGFIASSAEKRIGISELANDILC